MDLPTDPAPTDPAPADLISPELLERLTAGEERAWFEFVQEYEGRMYGYLYRLEGNSEDALDLTQEVFYRAWRSIRTFRAGERVLPWLYQVARNTQIESHRRKQLQRFSLEQAREDVGFEVTSEKRSPVQAAESADAQDRVQRALQQLPPEYREAVVLRFMEDLSYDEIAQIQGVALGTAKSRVFRAKEQLADLLESVADVN
ncbi:MULTISPECIES: RNA polymerase sigma factor [unclassified Deinococcus]|uniref:RNA polymerase sigma factor n=1 Tax=unclassified Deinococcus TaxID=2623546 RepID=UPI000994048C|nr:MULTISPECIES: sigma-70 family RNA polymerase sigma factor [unclassified Deinococcus]MCD0159587.1 sigma-70 family RNA polymerase sigma factor [Deinococcus sp. 6GRE01]MCD0163964.1 sigma-70 family RNA polymerase sigma factor [Deinococcus sp. 6YEL10]MCD0166477.1 sigma-70 family RNA polymerase sigma factor [Deinococcus sp. 12RED42]MCD0168250.1 sigma-70 family RNA polymerase sigma factor [Deinococcus sp. 23YEL01]OOV13757.1 RNA polymerase subunit sigma [Deinococcus sp. LM3]